MVVLTVDSLLGGWLHVSTSGWPSMKLASGMRYCLLSEKLEGGATPGADYGLGTIGTCLGSPPAGGPPSDQKNEKPMITLKKILEMTRTGAL